MRQAYVITGTLTDGTTVKLDEAVPIQAGKVRVVAEVIEPKPTRPFMEVMEEIWERQRQRGHVPPTAEEVQAYIRAERESWDDDADLR
jgi:hypothetical protein